MDKGSAIEVLKFYREIDGEISIYRRMIHDYEAMYYDTISPAENYGQPKGKYHISKPAEKAAMEIPGYVRKDMEGYRKEIERLQKIKSQILQEVSRLQLKEKKIIFDYYIHGMKWEQVAERNHYSDRQCKNIRDEAAEKLAERFGSSCILKGIRDKKRE